ncbi:MAG: hypothetical protein HQM04_08435, partial [Magnetococcales bacterium]|nr:hypothetical protein [Magnetococcales bacterium]MBF0115059.1 hypothetical protein [Magnetococcales bacterium]
ANTNNRALTITAGSGTVQVDGAIGQSQALYGLTVASASSTTLSGSVKFRNGGLSIASNNITFGGEYIDATDSGIAGDISISGPSLGAGASLTNIIVNNRINGLNSLIFEGNNITINGNITSDSTLNFINTPTTVSEIKNGSQVCINQSQYFTDGLLTLNGRVTLTSPTANFVQSGIGPIKLKGSTTLHSGKQKIDTQYLTTDSNSNILTSGGSVKFTGPVLFSGEYIINTNGGNIDFCIACAIRDSAIRNNNHLALLANKDNEILDAGVIKNTTLSGKYPYVDVYDLTLSGNSGSLYGLASIFPSDPSGRGAASSVLTIPYPHGGFYFNDYLIVTIAQDIHDPKSELKRNIIPVESKLFKHEPVFTEDYPVLYNALSESIKNGTLDSYPSNEIFENNARKLIVIANKTGSTLGNIEDKFYLQLSLKDLLFSLYSIENDYSIDKVPLETNQYRKELQSIFSKISQRVKYYKNNHNSEYDAYSEKISTLYNNLKEYIDDSQSPPRESNANGNKKLLHIISNNNYLTTSRDIAKLTDKDSKSLNQTLRKYFSVSRMGSSAERKDSLEEDSHLATAFNIDNYLLSNTNKSNRDVLIYSGHGYLHQGKLYFLTADSVTLGYNGESAFSTGIMSSDKIFSPWRLNITSSCHAGAASDLGNRSISSVAWDERALDQIETLRNGILDEKNDQLSFSLLLKDSVKVSNTETSKDNINLDQLFNIQSQLLISRRMNDILWFDSGRFLSNTPEFSTGNK